MEIPQDKLDELMRIIGPRCPIQTVQDCLRTAYKLGWIEGSAKRLPECARCGQPIQIETAVADDVGVYHRDCYQQDPVRKGQLGQ